MDLEDLIKNISEKKDEKPKEEFKGFYPYQQDDHLWILMLLLLLLSDFPKKEEKEPIIKIYIGGDE